MSPDREDDRIRRAAPPPEGESCVGAEELDAGLLVALRDGRLDGESRDDVEAHLIDCAFCRGMLRDLGEPVSPALAARMSLPLKPLRSRWRRPAWSFGAAGLAAAALALFVLTRPAPAPLPAYEVSSFGGGVVEMRGDDDAQAVPSFGAEGRVRFVVTPVVALSGEGPRAQAFVVRPGEAKLRALPPAMLAEAPTGAKVLDVAASEVFGEEIGPVVVAIALSREPSRLRQVEGRTPEDAASLVGVQVVSRRALYTGRRTP